MHATTDVTAPPRSAPIWSFQFVLVLLAIIAANITMTMMMPVMPLYLKQMGRTASLAGVVVGAFTFAALLCRPFWGKLLDTRSRKGVLLAGSVLITTMCFGYPWAVGLALLLAVRVVHGIGYAAATNATGTMAADLVPAARRSEGLGYYGVAFAASLALGPALSLRIVHTASIEAAFLAAGAIALVGLLCTLAIRSAPPAHAGHAAPAQGRFSWLEASALPASLVMALVAFNYSAVMTFVPSYMVALGLEGMSTFFLVYAATLLLVRLLIGRYTDKRGMTPVLIPGVVLMAAGFVLLAWAQSTPGFLGAAVLFGLGFGTVQPTLNALIISRCTPARRGAANATFFAAMDVGIGLGAVIWGVIAGAWGYPSIYLLGLLFFVAAVLSCLPLRREEQREAPGAIPATNH